MLYSERFVRDFGKINSLSNKYKHSKDWRDLQAEVRRLRRKILGIGDKGYLPMLARIKQDMFKSGNYSMQ
jgi:hypothetical protein